MVIYALLGVVFVWSLILTLITISTRRHYLNLVSRTKKQKIDEILDKLIESDEKLKTEITELKNGLTDLVHKSKFHLQKIGLVRFNPFERIAGEQSFVVAFLNQEDSGIVVNFIYTHDGLRVYTKKITKGKGDGINLSQEEERAIKESR